MMIRRLLIPALIVLQSQTSLPKRHEEVQNALRRKFATS